MGRSPRWRGPARPGRSPTSTPAVPAPGADGLTGWARVAVRIRTPNTAPQVVISAPANGSSAAIGTPITLTATATDDFDGALTGQLAWTSSRDGALGTGGSVAVPRLS